MGTGQAAVIRYTKGSRKKVFYLVALQKEPMIMAMMAAT